jgi:hypothetical protein
MVVVEEVEVVLMVGVVRLLLRLLVLLLVLVLVRLLVVSRLQLWLIRMLLLLRGVVLMLPQLPNFRSNELYLLARCLPKRTLMLTQEKGK